MLQLDGGLRDLCVQRLGLGDSKPLHCVPSEDPKKAA
jgi:hypothetical protein